jgi:FKBP-type peptidyl-prolyl cis-trans isomerase
MFLIIGCKKHESDPFDPDLILKAELEANEAAMIKEYLNKNSSLNFKLQSSGLYYCEILLGTGNPPILHEIAYIRYLGKYLGKIFDSHIGGENGFSFPVGERKVIAGLDEGIKLMKVGGKAIFLMPSKLAYGTEGYYEIPGYTPLLYEVELLEIGSN